MNKSVFVRLLCCILLMGALFYCYLNEQHKLTKIQIAVPRLEKEVKGLSEENIRLAYQIAQFENPRTLLTLAKKGEFAHLRHPENGEVITVESGLALEMTPEPKLPQQLNIKPKMTLAATTK